MHHATMSLANAQSVAFVRPTAPTVRHLAFAKTIIAWCIGPAPSVQFGEC
jgi:hypothetical protein